MIHIVFNESEVALMRDVIRLDDTLAGDVIQVKDDFAVGPLNNLDTGEGWQERYQWWMKLISYSHYHEKDIPSFDDRQTVASLRSRLDENPEEQVWIWMGQNQHDVCGYFWLMRQLPAYQGRILVLYLNNLPFINEKGQIFYPAWLHQIPAKEFLKAKKLARPITLSEFETDPDEWKRLAEENGTVRILEGGKKIVSKDEAFFDSEILKNLTVEWQKAWRLVGNTLNRMPIKTGDVFIEWRVKLLIEAGRIETLGEPGKSWKDFDVRKPGNREKEEIVSSAENTNQ